MTDKRVDKRYELSVGDLLKIPENRFDDFLIDLKKWHKVARDTLDLLNTLAEASGEKKTLSQIPKMVWIDDGKHDAHIIIQKIRTTLITPEGRKK